MDKKIIPKRDTYIVLITSLIFILSCILLKISLAYGFIAGIVLSFYIFEKRGYEPRNLIKMMWDGLIECRMIFVLLILIATTISIWLSSGIVPAMIYYGFEYMKGMNFLFAAFIITSIISIFMGTAFGTISTIGLALLGLGKGFGIPVHILLAAIISGAFIADKISPLSALLNLTLTTTNIRYREALKSMLVTLIPTYILSALFYFFIGRGYSITVDVSNLDSYKMAIKEGFFISPLLLLLPVLILVMSILGAKIIPTITLGSVVGIIISLTLQDLELINIVKAIFVGYRGTTASPELNEILISGGIVSMIEVIFIVMGVVALNSLFEGTRIIQPIIDNMIYRVKSKKELVFMTGILSSILTIVSCDQTVGIILPGRLLRNKYDELGVDHSILARTISDTGTIIAPLMPWNVNALFIYVIAGVSAISYAPYAVFCYLSPIITFTIFSLHKSKNKE
ncbi:Na+/H+ antiporter NhaC family protein [Wukongibacter baidiensis]|uniref:Na+/H+ antiporter NhaC family protein n=1 Tax=Wukongibacter baidiensis TaxID=1723361 RepID=UPI003D7FEDC4